jgi:hypothetical protein
MFKSGDKVLVRVMECTNEKFDQWEVVYRTAVVKQDNVLSSGTKKLFTVQFSNGLSEHVWSNHILSYPKEWVDIQSDLC